MYGSRVEHNRKVMPPKLRVGYRKVRIADMKFGIVNKDTINPTGSESRPKGICKARLFGTW